jgi:hypothetical protein
MQFILRGHRSFSYFIVDEIKKKILYVIYQAVYLYSVWGHYANHDVAVLRKSLELMALTPLDQ